MAFGAWLENFHNVWCSCNTARRIEEAPISPRGNKQENDEPYVEPIEPVSSTA